MRLQTRSMLAHKFRGKGLAWHASHWSVERKQILMEIPNSTTCFLNSNRIKNDFKITHCICHVTVSCHPSHRACVRLAQWRAWSQWDLPLAWTLCKGDTNEPRNKDRRLLHSATKWRHRHLSLSMFCPTEIPYWRYQELKMVTISCQILSWWKEDFRIAEGIWCGNEIERRKEFHRGFVVLTRHRGWVVRFMSTELRNEFERVSRNDWINLRVGFGGSRQDYTQHCMNHLSGCVPESIPSKDFSNLESTKLPFCLWCWGFLRLISTCTCTTGIY